MYYDMCAQYIAFHRLSPLIFADGFKRIGVTIKLNPLLSKFFLGTHSCLNYVHHYILTESGFNCHFFVAGIFVYLLNVSEIQHCQEMIGW